MWRAGSLIEMCVSDPPERRVWTGVPAGMQLFIPSVVIDENKYILEIV